MEKAQKGARPSVKAMVGEKGARLKGGARRVSTVAPYFVLIMVEARGVLLLTVPRVLEGVRIFVYVMVGGKDANLRDVGRVHKEARIFARHMVEGNVVLGAKLVFLVINLLGVNLAYVLPTMLRRKTNKYTATMHLFTH